MAVTLTQISKNTQSDCRAKALDTLADLYDQILAIENHELPTLIIDHSIMGFVRWMVLGVSDILINLPEKGV